jgi:hypothetical protein
MRAIRFVARTVGVGRGMRKNPSGRYFYHYN